MKKIFTLCASLLFTFTVVQAQIKTGEELDETFIFTDLEGNPVADGSTIVVTELNGEGQMVVPLKVKNASGEKAAVSMYEDISKKPSGSWTTCAFGNCLNLDASGYSPKNIMAADYNSDIQTEWIPEAGKYGTWEAKLQIHIFNITTKMQFGQPVESAGNEVIGCGPTVTVRFEYKNPDEQKETATLIMGPYTTDEVAANNGGLGLYRYPGTLRVATELPVEDFMAFNGGKVVKMRVGLANAAAITRIFISTVGNNSITEVMSQDVKANAEGWSEFELATPYTLDMNNCEALLIGYDYTQTSSAQSYGSFPISMVQAGSTTYTTIIYGNLGQGEGWYNAGLSAYGNLSVQCYVESSDFPEKDIVLFALDTDQNYYKAGEELTLGLQFQNFGIGQASKLDFDVEIDDKVATTFAFTESIGSLEAKNVQSTLTLGNDLGRGEHKIGVRLKTVDGEAPAGNLDNDYISTTFNVYEQSVARQKNLLEQFTSQYCTYCPRGVTFFSDLIELRDDVAWVSVHGNMSSGNDIYHINANDTIMSYMDVSGYPSASFNRTYIGDLADNDTEIAYGLGYNMNYRTQVVNMFSQAIDYTAEAPSFVTLNINQEYNPETRQLNITVVGSGVEHAAEILADYGITVYITENGLIARQLNEGTWESKFEHHYVLRAVLGKSTGNNITWNGDNFTAKFNYTIPDSYVKDNMYVVAFVAPKATLGQTNTKALAVNNCEMVSVKDAGANSIQTVNVANTTKERYALDGRQLQEAKRGLNIVRMSDGNVRKVVIK